MDEKHSDVNVIANTGLAVRSYAVPAGATDVIPAVAQISRQETSNWCWAAVITSIVAAKAHPPNPAYTQQCQLAQAVLSLTDADCCGADKSRCNQALPRDRIAGTSATSPLAIAGIGTQPPAWSDNQVADTAIKTALRGGKPTCLVIEWPSLDLHVVAIVGAATKAGVQEYLIGDPQDGLCHWFPRASIQHYSEYTGAGGVWRDSYVTI